MNKKMIIAAAICCAFFSSCNPCYPWTQVSPLAPGATGSVSTATVPFNATQQSVVDQKVDKNGVQAGQRISIYGSGTASSPYVFSPSQQVKVSPSQPSSDFDGIWIDTSVTPAASKYNNGSGWVATGGGVTSYSALTDKPTIPSTLADLSADSTHRVVTDAEKSAWNAKQSPLTAGTDYIAPNGSAANLTNFPAALATDSEVASAVAGKESSLGNPSISGWCLQSTNGGVRSWGVCGGVADATADSKTYGRLNGAWVPVLNASDVVNFSATMPLLYNNGNLSIAENSFQPPLVSGVNIKSLVVDGVPTSILGPGSINIGSGQPPTNVTADPTAASANGTYRNTVTGHWWSVDDVGLSDISAGAYTPWDTTPASFGFGAITGASAGQIYCYPGQELSGIDRSSTIAVVGASTSYKLNAGSATNDAGVYSSGDTISPCLPAPSTAGETIVGNLTVGGVTGSPAFSVTTGSVGVVLSDTLYSASTVAIESYIVSPGPGGAWTLNGADTGVVSTGGAYAGTTNGFSARNAVTVGNGKVVATGKTGTAATTRAIRAYGRINPAQAAVYGYFAQLNGIGELTIRRVNNGVATDIATPVTCSGHDISAYYNLTLNMSATGVSASVDLDGDVQCTIAEVADTTYTSGYVGIGAVNTSPRLIEVKAYEN